jgi:hypothetical protein
MKNLSPVWILVIQDIVERDKFGQEKHGNVIHEHTHENPLREAYEEVLDAAVYLREAIARAEKTQLKK